MENNNSPIFGGAFFLARKIFNSKLWLEKPSTWKILWIYILGKVNHKSTPQRERGTGFFNFTQEKSNIGIDITDDKIKKALRFMRSSSMIDTERSTRGMLIKVLLYNTYQDRASYVSTTGSTREAREKHESSTPIYNNGNNGNNVNIYNTDVLSQPKNLEIKLHERLPIEKQQLLHRLVYYLEDTLKTKIVNWGKQAKAVKMMVQAGYEERQIKNVITYMATSDEFFEDKGFDMMTVANNIARYKAEQEKRGGVKND